MLANRLLIMKRYLIAPSFDSLPPEVKCALVNVSGSQSFLSVSINALLEGVNQGGTT